MDDLTLGQIRQLSQIFSAPAHDSPAHGVCIVVLQRGWVAVGRYNRVGDECTLTSASIIRRWGTTRGLPELATGPTSETILDKSNYPIRFHRAAEVLVIDCDEKGWKGYVD